MPFTPGAGGDGGDGRGAGTGGVGGTVNFVTPAPDGVNGQIDGTGSGWGLPGVSNGGSGGNAGSGVEDNGATITLHGTTPARYINGQGSHP